MVLSSSRPPDQGIGAPGVADPLPEIGRQPSFTKGNRGDDSRGRPTDEVLRHVAALLQRNMAVLIEQMTSEIQSRIPEYSQPGARRTIEASVEQALLRFQNLLEHRQRDETWRGAYRSIGAGERKGGRSFNSIQTAIRLGARVGWRQLLVDAEREAIPVRELIPLAERIFNHMDDLADTSAAGYADAQAAEVSELERHRQRLATLLVAEPAASPETLAAAAATARWRVPNRLAGVALRAREPETAPPVLSPEILTGYDRSTPFLIVPDPGSGAQVRAIINGLTGYRVAVGPAVPVERGAHSLRHARQALDLALRGIIATEGIVWCADHLSTLAIFQDEDLIAALIKERLAPLARIGNRQRLALSATLLAWLQLNMNASEVATQLGIHPQTVRSRIRQLVGLFGDQLHDRNRRFTLELALVADQARRGTVAASAGRQEHGE